jgi:hypothetical protein
VSQLSHGRPVYAVNNYPLNTYNPQLMDELGGTDVPFVSYAH